jgi:hypothetical protein
MKLYKENMRKEFTEAWGKLNSNAKSLVISAGAIVLATGILFASKALFPSYDFSELQLVVITAISGFATNLIKNFVKTD